VQFDLRVLAATSRDLQQRIKEGKFRRDLLFRINVIPIRLPPLREREGDVALLSNYLLEKYCEVDTGMIKRFDSEVLQAFDRYSWPGNVRELQNVVRRMCVMAEGEVIAMRDLPEELLPANDQSFSEETEARIESCQLTFVEAKRKCLNLFEAQYVRGVLDRHAGNVSRSSEAADVDRKTFYRLLRKHHLQPHAFRTLETYRVSA
jgi:DNA-binding NtrC family response regulator